MIYNILFVDHIHRLSIHLDRATISNRHAKKMNFKYFTMPMTLYNFIYFRSNNYVVTYYLERQNLLIGHVISYGFSIEHTADHGVF